MQRFGTLCVGLLACAMTSGTGMATDLAVRKAPVAEPRVQVAEADCIRWVRQTQSWFNYCEPVPYYGYPPSHYEWGWNLRWGERGPLGWDRAPYGP